MIELAVAGGVKSLSLAAAVYTAVPAATFSFTAAETEAPALKVGATVSTLATAAVAADVTDSAVPRPSV